MPLGLTSEEMITWMKFSGGYELWREMYAKFNLYPLIGGTTGPQMGGWFKKEINTLEDLKGLKMRIPGLGGEVFSKLGVKPIQLPAGEIFISLERNMLDATEWLGPSLDTKMGFQKAPKYYFTGWHEPGSMLSLVFNKKKLSKLSDEQKLIIEVATQEMNAHMASEFQYQNAKSLKEIESLGDVKIQSFPKPIMEAAKKAMIEVAKEKSAKSADFKKVWESASSFLQETKSWSDIGMSAYLKVR
jgi:TRAP-type mannitol/chloroaromatic compound transport system substrate-binding protein